MFLDRDSYIEKLNTLYHGENFETAVLCSAPGMGKTTFLQQFSTQKNCLYFRAALTTEKENFHALKQEAIRVLGENKKLTDARRFAELFRAIGKAASEQRLLFIIDDYPHLIKQNRRLSTLIQNYIKKEWTTSRLFLIFCKPVDAYEKEAAQNPNVMLLRPFTFFETRQLFRHYTLEEQIYLYGITGGVPGYFQHFDPSLSLQENLFQLFFRESGTFYRLPEEYLRIHAPLPELAHSALLTLKSQRRKLHEICERTELTPSAAGSLLTGLDALKLTEKIIPVTEEEGSRRTMYRICDGVFRFWYTFVSPYVNQIAMGHGRDFFENEVLPQLNTYFKDTFEDICIQFLFLLKQTDQAPFPYERIGSWWGQHPTKKRTEYVPIAASNENNMLLGACFWTDEWIDLDALTQLQKHASLFPHSTKWYILFAKSDFVSGMETIFGDSVKVYTLEQMCTLAEI